MRTLLRLFEILGLLGLCVLLGFIVTAGGCRAGSERSVSGRAETSLPAS